MYLKLAVLFALLSYVPVKGQNAIADSLGCTHTNCTCDNDITPAGVMVSHVHNKKEWMVSYRFMTMNMSGIYKDSKQQNEDDIAKSYGSAPTLMQMNMQMLMLMYGISDRLTLMGMINYNSNYMEMTMLSGTHYHKHSMTSSGISDTKLYAIYALLKKPFSQLVLNLGLNLPNGTVNVKGPNNSAMYSNQLYPYLMQPGSGTADVLPGIGYFYRNNKTTLGVQVTGNLRSGFNKNGYRLGNEINLNCWLARQWLSILNSSLRLEANNSGEIKAHNSGLNVNEDISTNPANYGGTRITSFIGYTLQGKRGFLKKNRISLEYGLTLYQHLNGLQMPVKNTLFAAWSLTF